MAAFPSGVLTPEESAWQLPLRRVSGLLKTKIHGHRKSVFTYSQTLSAGIAQPLHIGVARGNLCDPMLDPVLKATQITRLVVIFMEKSMVAAIVTLHGRRMRAPGLVYNRSN